MNGIYQDGDIIYVDSFAKIENGIVTDILWIAETNADEFPDCIRLDGRPVEIGDTYDGETFYHDGAKVLTTAERLADAESALNVLGVSE